jgi:hypothetical protein
MKRSGRLARHTPLKSGKRIKAKPRTKAERTRIYGPPGRVEWMQRQPCLVCGRTPSVNAHTVTGGTGRKADADTIVPLCDPHHRAYDEHRAPFNAESRRNMAKDAAFYVERAWQLHCAGALPAPVHLSFGPELTPLSAIVPGVVAKILEGGE